MYGGGRICVYTSYETYLIFVNISNKVTGRAILPGEEGSIRNPSQLLTTNNKDGRYVQSRCD